MQTVFAGRGTRVAKAGRARTQIKFALAIAYRRGGYPHRIGSRSLC